MTRRLKPTLRVALYVWMPLGVLLLWWFGPAQKALYFPSLKVVVDAFNKEWLGNGAMQLRTDLVPSVEHVAIGYAIALVLGIILGLLLSRVTFLYNLSLPLITFFRSLPSPALIPALLLIFGLGGNFKIAIIAFGSTWPVLLNAYDGFRSVDPIQLDTARSYQLTRRQRYLQVMLPAASPQIVAGARTALQVAVLLMVASEFLGVDRGHRLCTEPRAGQLRHPRAVVGDAAARRPRDHVQRSIPGRRAPGLGLAHRHAGPGGEGMTSEQRVVVSVQELGRTYVDRKGQGNEAIRSVSFDVRERELLCIVGPSGAGKTTLLRCLAGLLAPTTGRALFEGEEVVRSPAGIAVVFQDYSRSLFPWLSVAGNIALPLKAKRVSKGRRSELVENSLNAVGLHGEGGRYPWQLSGGMQQRVAIARALAYGPDLLLMDEPFASVDAQTRFELEDLVLRVRDEFGMTVVFVTHDIDEAVYVGDRVIVLSKSPCVVVRDIPVQLQSPRSQEQTRSDPMFVELRTEVLRLVTDRRHEAADLIRAEA